ncbi:guanine nucleotide-binding protein subunit beta-2-like [Diaphorina citri]|uniref:Guanine nucleotide-binding protein subunit beta-2-like n=1 Tax=Diaphorina citri TaxID=121845 RepID=A0A3Q0J1B8_DIACI|nr:guanine nucleotide-binding protein subunit beta-2-like [Diaphorina citri]
MGKIDMSQEGTSMKSESIEALTREAESLKHKLEEERQKLNDVTLATVADRLETITFINIKTRKTLKGHVSKVLCSDWSPDKRHLVSCSQVKIFQQASLMCFNY